jgi:hypothetical protein
MDASGRGKGDNRERADRVASAKPPSAAPLPDEAAAPTQISLVSPFAHPRGAKQTEVTFNLRQFVARHPVPVALSCLALGGAIAAVILKRQRRDTWDARIDRLRQAFVQAANSVG